MTDRELLETAEKAMENAYAPYSDFKVGAALLCADGAVFTGCNIENASYGASNCAERTAVFKAVSEGKRDFLAIAIVSSGGEETFPCGICRQVLAEFAPDIRVVLQNKAKNPVSYQFNEIMPNIFSLKT
ncbi:MAG: cytidine deaminase [Ruminococcus sp.]|nr:cytidine deaminase [Ruminococcus sp.]MCM1480574.1 cytidine deaminase [Muribaculaceae bacterium]